MNGRMQKWCVALGLAVGLVGARVASADITIADYNADPSAGEYQYIVEIDPGSSANEIVNGDGFALYDWPGLETTGDNAPTLTGIPGLSIADFLVEQSKLGNYLSAPNPSDTNTPPVTPNGVDNQYTNLGLTDNPNVENISFVYNGTPFPNVATSQIGILTLYSTNSPADNPNGGDASVDSSGANESLSYVNDYNTVPVPEPATLGVLAGGAAMLLSGRRFRNKASA
jgi:hypothetical protein